MTGRIEMALLIAAVVLLVPASSDAQFRRRPSPPDTNWWSIESVRAECDATAGRWVEGDALRDRTGVMHSLRVDLAPAQALVAEADRGAITAYECVRQLGDNPSDDIYYALGDVVVMRHGITLMHSTALPTERELVRLQHSAAYGVVFEHSEGAAWLPRAWAATDGDVSLRLERRDPAMLIR